MQELTGGRFTLGVVKVGDTVRRPSSPASPFVERLLKHLAAKGFEGCPRHLGRDELDRDTLSFIPGEVPASWRYFPDAAVAAAARLLRRMHDASRDFEPFAEAGRVVCHHDPGPNNVVFRGGRPVAFIDFDFAAPGHPLEDLGYLAWSWCLSSKPERGPVAEQARQVRLLADSYGLAPAERVGLPSAIRDRLVRNEAFWHGILRDGQEIRSTREYVHEVLAWTARELSFFDSHRDTFAAAMG